MATDPPAPIDDPEAEDEFDPWYPSDATTFGVLAGALLISVALFFVLVVSLAQDLWP